MRSAFLTSIVAAVVGFAGLGLSAAAQQTAVIETESGRTFEGQLLSETDANVILLISGIETPIRRSDIKTITIKRAPADIYTERRAALDDDDLDGRYALAYDMFELREFDLAQLETTQLLQKFPDAERVRRLDGVISDAIALRDDREATARTTPPRTRPETNGETAPTGGPGELQRLREQQLTDDDINLIRIWELPTDLTQLRPRIIIPRDAIEALLRDYGDREGIPRGRNEQNAFRRAEGWQQLPLFFQMRARELYPKIRVVEDPPVMSVYRREIAPLYINNYFARNFGQGQVPGLMLFGGRGERVRALYTDFYILHNFRMGDLRMIDRDKPAESLLVQWGLPRDQATHKAPEVPGWRPHFSGRNDPKFISMVEWIDSLYKTVDYGINYRPPVGVPAVTTTDR